MQLMSTGSESIKAQVVDKIPKRIKELKFGIQYVPAVLSPIKTFC
jgi:DNA-directed RNA polymerase III subunit RPC1